jgi:hypothetical protein
VEIAPLPGVATAIGSSLAGHSPNAGNALSAALQGALDHATTWAGAHAADKTVVVIVTDTAPSECDMNISDIAAIASGTPSVPTYILGLGTGTSVLDSVAAAGGTGTVTVVDTSGNTQAQVANDLGQILTGASACSYALAAPDGGVLDTSRVNVSYTPSGGSPHATTNVADAAHCPTSGDAWYFGAGSPPASLTLCPATCTTARAGAGSVVDLLVGCPTQK